MGVYSTLTVSRKAALDKIDKLREKRKSNEELERILEAYLMERTLHNFIVVDSEEDAEDDNYLDSLLSYEHTGD
jgi:hypothetical protein